MCEGWLEKLSVSAPAAFKNWKLRYLTLGRFADAIELAWRDEPGDERDDAKCIRIDESAKVVRLPRARFSLMPARDLIDDLEVTSTLGTVLRLRSDDPGLLDSWESAIGQAIALNSATRRAAQLGRAAAEQGGTGSGGGGAEAAAATKDTGVDEVGSRGRGTAPRPADKLLATLRIVGGDSVELQVQWLM